MRKFYYLNRQDLLNGTQRVLHQGNVRLSEEDLNTRFGIGKWVEYVGDRLPPGLRLNPTTNILEIVNTGDNRQKKHLIAAANMYKSFYGPHNLDLGGIQSKTSDTFQDTMNFGGNPIAFTFENGAVIRTYKADGKEIDLMQVDNKDVVNVTPNGISSVFGGNVTVNGQLEATEIIKGRKDVVVSGTNPTISLKAVYQDIINLKKKLDDITDMVPIGTICMYHTKKIPAGWLPCDGRKLDINKYREFIQTFGTNMLPDLRGVFVRGWGEANTPDATRTINTFQHDGGRNIVGSWPGGESADHSWDGTGAVKSDKRYNQGGSAKTDYDNQGWTFDASRVWGANHTAKEFRPMNVSLMFAIKVVSTTSKLATFGEVAKTNAASLHAFSYAK